MASTAIFYKHKDKEYTDFRQVRKLFPHVSLPAEPTDEQLAKFGIERVEKSEAEQTKLTLAELKAQMKTDFAMFRWNDETAGIFIGGIYFATDRESQTKILSMLQYMQVNPDYVISDWKLKNGEFISLNYEQMKYLADCMMEHVEFQYTKEATLVDAINRAKSIRVARSIKWYTEDQPEGAFRGSPSYFDSFEEAKVKESKDKLERMCL